MKKADRIKSRLLTGVIALVLGLGIFGWGFTQAALVSHAESQAKVTAPKGANIRKEASTSSAAVGGAENGKVLTVISQVQGGDGNTWYQVKSGDITGYIRSDLVEVSEGSVPSEGGESGNGEGGGAAPADITAVNPINAVVSGDSGRIRDSASSEGQIIAEVAADTMLTVTGQATDADGRAWYQVNFLSGDTQVEGFIRYDYVTLSGELTPLTGDPATPAETDEPVSDPEPETKLYETILQDGAWLLVDNTGAEPKGYSINKLFEGVTGNTQIIEESQKTVKNQKIIIIILVFLLVAAAAGIAFLVFKVRDLMDSAYFNEVEKETMRKKKNSGDRGGQSSRRTAGQDRPAGARTSGYSQRPSSGSSQSQRPSGYGQGERTAGQVRGGSVQGQRPAGTSQSQRPAGNAQGMRPAGAAQGQRTAGPGQEQRPAGASQGQRPVRTMEPRPAGAEGARHMGTSQGAAGSSQGVRQPGAQPGTRRPAGAPQGNRPASDASQRGGTAPGARPARPAQSSPQKAQSRNFIAEDDDDGFEHEFLNYDE